MVFFAATSEVIKISRFGLIGVFNTLVDFTIFNALSSHRVGWSKLAANTVSTTVAMTLSFFLNRSYVFRGGGNELEQAIAFFAVTAAGLYILQNGVIYFLTTYLKWPTELTKRFLRKSHVPLEQEFVLKNAAKVIGTIASLTWNYILYGRIVFRG